MQIFKSFKQSLNLDVYKHLNPNILSNKYWTEQSYKLISYKDCTIHMIKNLTAGILPYTQLNSNLFNVSWKMRGLLGEIWTVFPSSFSNEEFLSWLMIISKVNTERRLLLRWPHQHNMIYNKKKKKTLAFYSHLHKDEWSKNQNTDILHSLTKRIKSPNMQQMKH